MPVCKNNFIRMRHERTCHVFKGFVGKCAVCGERFTTSKLIWNAINKLWNDQCSVKNCQPYFENDVIFPLSKEKADIVTLKISFAMEYFPRHPDDTLKSSSRANPGVAEKRSTPARALKARVWQGRKQLKVV